MAETRTLTKPAPFILDETYVRQDAQGRYSLNDLHQAAGGEERDKPSNWLRLDQTQALIGELGNCSDLSSFGPVATVEGRNGGTYVVRELVYAYAMWINAAFHLKVIRTFDALTTGRLAGTAPQAGPASGLPVAQLISLQEQSWKLITRLRAEDAPDLRAALYAQLCTVLGDLGQAVPPLTAIGADAPQVPAAVTSFWDTYTALTTAGEQLNHHRDPSRIAVCLSHFLEVATRHRLSVPGRKELIEALPRSRAPRFLDTRAVNSAVRQRSLWCCVFDASTWQPGGIDA